MRPNCAGSLILPSTRTIESLAPCVMRPAGTSWLAARMAVIDLVDADPERGQRVRLDLHQDLPRHAAADVDARHAGDVLQALDDRLVGERGELAQAHRRRQHGERDDRLLVLEVGAQHQRILDVAREARAHLRRSCRGRPASPAIMSVAIRNSANTSLLPSSEFERISLTPETVLIAYSSGLVTSASTTSGDAPGIGRQHQHEGQADVGHLLDAQPVVREEPEHGDADHHHGGEHRVVDRDAGDPHGGGPGGGDRDQDRRAAAAPGSRPALALRRRALTSAGAPSFRLSKRAARTASVRRAARVFTSTRPAASSRRPTTTSRRGELAALDRPDERLPGLGADRRLRQRRRRRVGGERDAARREHAAAQAAVGVRDSDVDEDRARPGFRRRVDPLDAPGEAALAEAVDRELDRHRRSRAPARRPAGTTACSSMSLRSTTVTSGESKATFSPGWTWRLATMPASGEVDDGVAQRVARDLHLRLGRLDRRPATTLRLDSELS